MFQPGSSTELASVADDSSLLFWDTRSGIAPVLRMAEAHGASDLHVVDWSSLRPELVATGIRLPMQGQPKQSAAHDWHVVDVARLQLVLVAIVRLCSWS